MKGYFNSYIRSSFIYTYFLIYKIYFVLIYIDIYLKIMNVNMMKYNVFN
jgi:hypothetical protein